MMKPKISIVTLGVADLQKATRFYKEGLGLPEYEFDDSSITFFALQGTWLALYPIDSLAEDIGIRPEKKGEFCGITLAHNVGSKKEVDDVLQLAVNAGAVLVKPGQDVFWGGYSGYFKDLDGYFWEVAYNPFQDLT